MFTTCRPRSTRALTARIQTPTCLSGYCTVFSPHIASRTQQKTQRQQTCISPRPPPFPSPSFRASPYTSASLARLIVPFRYASTTATTTPISNDISGATSTGTPPPSQSAPSEGTLTWNRFLALRRIRRRISLLTSVIGAILAMGGGVIAITAQDLDSLGATRFGLDPIIVLGLSTFAFAAGGWLIGPVFGNAIFKTIYRREAGEMRMKERAFYARIKRFRVDPSSSSMANPVPDYYGEKIGSVADYRRWLKDQRAFNLKRGRMV